MDLSSIFPNLTALTNASATANATPLSTSITPTLSSASYTVLQAVTGTPNAYSVGSQSYSIQPKFDLSGILNSVAGFVNQGTGIYNSVKSVLKPQTVNNIPVQEVGGIQLPVGTTPGTQISPPSNTTNTTATPSFITLPGGQMDLTGILLIGGALLVGFALMKAK